MANIFRGHTFTAEELYGNIAILVEISESYAYEGDKRSSEPDGLKYTVVLPKRRYEKMTVKIEGSTTPTVITREELDRSLNNMEPIYVVFDGFAARIYEDYRNAGIGTTATAKSIRKTSAPLKAEPAKGGAQA